MGQLLKKCWSCMMYAICYVCSICLIWLFFSASTNKSWQVLVISDKVFHYECRGYLQKICKQFWRWFSRWDLCFGMIDDFIGDWNDWPDKNWALKGVAKQSLGLNRRWPNKVWTLMGIEGQIDRIWDWRIGWPNTKFSLDGYERAKCKL